MSGDAVEVRSPGLFTTVQDLGRYGYGPLGVSPSGAADTVALRLGNVLVGNAPSAAGLEMTLLGGVFAFPAGAVIAVTGADFGPSLDGVPLALCAAHEVRPGQVLQTGPTRSGARCYLSVQGGIAVKPFLGSASTHVLAGLGGLEGRPLRAGDVLRIGPRTSGFSPRAVSTRVLERLGPRRRLRVTAGPQSGWFTRKAQADLFGCAYRVSEESNRMGLRLEGKSLELLSPGRSMLTEGVPLGAIQVPPSGQPIILFVEQQTTGGYPKIANVISADLSSVGQLRPRDELHFEPVSPAQARALIIEQERLLETEELLRG